MDWIDAQRRALKHQLNPLRPMNWSAHYSRL